MKKKWVTFIVMLVMLANVLSTFGCNTNKNGDIYGEPSSEIQGSTTMQNEDENEPSQTGDDTQSEDQQNSSGKWTGVFLPPEP